MILNYIRENLFISILSVAEFTSAMMLPYPLLNIYCSSYSEGCRINLSDFKWITKKEQSNQII
jgi:hypothetical protein